MYAPEGRYEMDKDQYYLVKAEVLPDVFLKVMQVNELLSSGKAKSINDAVKQTGLSRTAFYKYRDAVLPFYESSKGQVLSLVFLTEDFPGVLSGIIDCLAQAKVNVLTINQNYPINGLADISVVADTSACEIEIAQLMQQLGRIRGVREQNVLARGSAT